MSSVAIQSVLQQMRALTPAAGAAAPRPEAAAGAGGSFGAELRKSLDSISGAQNSAYKQAEAFELGTPGVALNDVMIDLQKANVAFQTGLQVRNRLVAAYQEIMNLPV